jgi:putative spermidine/putrescine transport system permease protein
LAEKGKTVTGAAREWFFNNLSRVVPFCFLAVLLGMPLCWILLLSFGYPDINVDAYVSLLESGAHLRIGYQTLAMAATATAVALLLGYPVAYVTASLRAPWALVAVCVVSFPLWTSLLVRTYAWLVILAPDGPLNQVLRLVTPRHEPLDLSYNRFGTVIGLTHSIMPYLILPIYAAIRKIDPELTRAAESLGATRVAVFSKVVFPLSLPGVIAGCLFAFLLAMGAFVIPALLGGPSERTIGMVIENAANQLLNWNNAAALAVELLLATVCLLFAVHKTIGLQTLFGGEPSYRRSGRILHPVSRLLRMLTTPRRKRVPLQLRSVPRKGTKQRAFDFVMRTIAGFAFVFLAAPLIIVIPISFSSGQYLRFPPPGFSLQWYERYFGNPQWLHATALSVLIGLAVVALSVIVGVLAAISARKMSSIPRTILTVGCVAPMIIPNMVLALGFYFSFSQLHLVGTWIGLVLAHSLLALPFVFVTVDSALREIDPSLERAASMLGASPMTAFRKIVLPLLKPSILTGALFAFIVSFDEIVVALFLTSFSVRTLPKMMWENITMFIDPTISAVSVLLVGVSMALMMMAQMASQGRRKPTWQER